MKIIHETIIPFKAFHADGTPSIVGFECTKTRLKVGEWKFYHENGNLSLVGHYKNGLEHGEHRSYYENGQLKIVSLYDNNSRVGEWKFFTESGRLAKTEYYENGFLIQTKHPAASQFKEVSSNSVANNAV